MYNYFFNFDILKKKKGKEEGKLWIKYIVGFGIEDICRFYFILCWEGSGFFGI